MRNRSGRFILSITALLGVSTALAGDWPQILGPRRDGKAPADEKIAARWPAAGPKTLWSRKVGQGFAGVAVVKDRCVVFHRVDDLMRVEALDARTGKPVWKDDAPTTFSTPYSSDKGPRCVPLVHRGKVYAFGPQGLLRCLDVADGHRLWDVNTHDEFTAPEGYFGAGSTPIVAGENLVVNVGSRRGAGIVAFNLSSGKVAWKAISDTASYSSPVAATVGGVQHLIFITRMKTVSLDPTNGKVRFEFAFGKRGPTVNAASPVVLNGHLFCTAHYGIGAVWSKIGKSSAERKWANVGTLSAQYTTPIAVDGLLYGVHGQERLDPAEFRCIDPATGKVLWSKRDQHYGSLLLADGKLLMLTVEGELILIRPDKTGYKELARTRLFDTTTRALPALSGGRLFARDEDTLKCVSLK